MNKNKKIILVSCLFSVIITLVFTIITIVQCNGYAKIVDTTVNRIVNTVMEKYPETNEEEIIKIINGKEEAERETKNILEKYGYKDEINYIKELKQTMEQTIIIQSIMVFTICLLWIIILLIYRKKENNQIEKINQYFNQLNKRNYELKISENKDDEFTKLRNEIYKTTVLLKEEAQSNQKEKEQLSDALADISHQIKTPLTSITIMLDNILENPDMDNQTKNDFIREISRQIEWISSLVISLLKLAKIDAGAIKLNAENVKVEKLVNGVVENLAVMTDIKNIEIIKEIPKNAKIKVDYKWQVEALTNIVKNSIEHSTENSKIYIKVEDTSVFLKIKIIDEGKGIAKEDLKHIFERFYKGKDSNESSIGIGLALAKSIIEKENGYVTVQTEINKGTTFEIKYLK